MLVASQTDVSIHCNKCRPKNMAKYLTSRLLLVFLCKFFYNWAFNTKFQLVQFFNFSDGYILDTLSYLMLFLILCLGLITINLLFSILHISEEIPFEEIIKKVRDKGLLNTCVIYFKNFWTILSNNFKIETRAEKYPNLFLVFVLIFLPFSKGNPILNNYYGIYKEYEIDDQDNRTNYIENQNYIVHKSRKNEIRGRMNSLEENSKEDEPYFDVNKRGYLFVQSGLIDGYKTFYKEYDGLLPYIECLFFSALEKLINTIMYFFIPFIIFITIYHFKYDHSKTINN